MSGLETSFLISGCPLHFSSEVKTDGMLSVRTVPSLALFLAGAMDCLTTVIGISFFGAVEVNPILSNIARISIAAFIVTKLTSVSLVALMFHQANRALMSSPDKGTRTFKFASKTLKVSYAAATIVLLAAVINNIIVFAKLA